jgi:hypothetical protein
MYRPHDPRDARLCGARLSRDRGYCRAIAISGRGRCRWHGGKSTGPRTPWGKARCVAAMQAGRAKWVAGLREAKRLGLIEKFPGGRPKGGSRRSAALVHVQRLKAEHAAPPATISLSVEPSIDSPSAEPLADTLERAVGRALDFYERALLPVFEVCAENPKRLEFQRRCARDILSIQAHVEPSRLLYRRASMMPELLRSFKAAEERAAKLGSAETDPKF